MSWWSRLKALFRPDMDIIFTPEEDEDEQRVEPAEGGDDAGIDAPHSTSIESILKRLQDPGFLIQVGGAAQDLPPHLAGAVYELLGLSKRLLEHTVEATDALNSNWRIVAALIRQTPSRSARIEPNEIATETLTRGSLLQLPTDTNGLYLRWVEHTSPRLGEGSRN